MAGQTYDPYAVFADTPGPTPDLSQIPTAQLQALLDARNAADAAGSGAVPGKAGLFDDLIPQGSAGQPQPAGTSDGNWWGSSPIVQPAATSTPAQQRGGM